MLFIKILKLIADISHWRISSENFFFWFNNYFIFQQRYATSINNIIAIVLSQKRPALANQKAVILLHDNSRPHVAQLTQQKIEQLGWEVLLHSPWSLDLAPSDYHLFLSLRNYPWNKHYEDFDELKSDLTAFFESKPGSFYRRGIELLPERWAKVVENNGDYIVDWCCISLLKNKVIIKPEKKILRTYPPMGYISLFEEKKKMNVKMFRLFSF